jgi:hypothetical protein
LQTFVEQKLDFLLREYFGLPVPFYLHLGKLDPIPESLPQILHYCIRRGYFLMRRVRQGEAEKGAELSTKRGGRSQSGSLILLVLMQALRLRWSKATIEHNLTGAIHQSAIFFWLNSEQQSAWIDKNCPSSCLLK